jgi:hypothetical protein
LKLRKNHLISEIKSTEQKYEGIEYKIDQTQNMREAKLQTLAQFLIKEKMHKDYVSEVDNLASQISSMYAFLEAENNKMDKIRYEIVSETEEKMRQACEIEAENESRKWAMVWAERENLSLVGNLKEESAFS